MKAQTMTLEDHANFAKKINEAKQNLIDLLLNYSPKCHTRESDMLNRPIKSIEKIISEFEDKMFRDHWKALEELRTNNADLRIYYP